MRRSFVVPLYDGLTTDLNGEGPAGDAPSRSWLRVLVPALAGSASLAVSWQRWIDPVIDSGRELDVPARVAAGERLYRDVAYYYGPLAPWANALAIRILGRRFLAIEIVGVALACAIILLLYRIALAAGSSRSALAAASLAAAVCVGGRPGIGFVFPYAFANLYALLGTLLAACGLTGRRRRDAVFFGAGLSLVLLARPEYGIAMTVLAVFALPRMPERDHRRRVVLAAGSAWALAALVHVLALGGLDLREGIAGPFSFLRPPPEWSRLYRNVAGISTPFRIGKKLLLSSIALATVLGGAVAWARLTSRRRAEGARNAMRLAGWALAVAIGVSMGVAAARAELRPTWGPNVDVLLPIPLMSLVLAGVMFFSRASRALPRFVLFSITALWSMRVMLSLTVGYRMNPYDGPAVPLAITSLAVVVFDIWGDRLRDRVEYRRNTSAFFLAIGVFYVVRIGAAAARDHAVPARTAAGTLRLEPRRAAAVVRTLEFLKTVRNTSLVSLPEAGFFQFVTGMTNPLRQEQILPGMLTADGEDEVVARIRAARPVVLIMNRPTPEFGKGKSEFGRDFARTIFRTIGTDDECRFSTIGDSCTTPIGDPAFFVHGYMPRDSRAKIDRSKPTIDTTDRHAESAASFLKRPPSLPRRLRAPLDR